MTMRWTFAAVLAAAVLAGCAGVEQRVARNQTYFDGLPVAAQARIRGGDIDLGFTAKMVEIALGEPTAKVTRVSPGVEREVWIYAGGSEVTRQQVTLEAAGRTGTGWVTMNVPKSVPEWRVEFVGGRVASYERGRRAGDAEGGELTGARGGAAAP